MKLERLAFRVAMGIGVALFLVLVMTPGCLVWRECRQTHSWLYCYTLTSRGSR
jgi:hypothetical protein